ncbi:PrsW family intramembrane metalloprotease [Gottschalkiaceae bacterium SANA]|nr:PrsW family intramembrane metalloprotease [Gottschalkiaceae bacterium SANA]
MGPIFEPLRLMFMAVLPAVILIVIMVYLDRYDREPARFMFQFFFWGAFSVLPVLGLETILSLINPFRGSALEVAYIAFVVAGFTEEWMKRRFLLRGLWKAKVFDQRLDGIVFSVLIALGFATVENISYVFFQYAQEPLVAVYRGVLSVPAHMLFAIAMGYEVSLAKFSPTSSDQKRHLRKSLWVPVLLHGLFDFILMAERWGLMIFFFPFLLYLWISNVKKLKRFYKDAKRIHLEQENGSDEEEI